MAVAGAGNAAIENAARKLSKILEDAEQIDEDEFCKKPGFYLGGGQPFQILADLLKSERVASFEEFEANVSKDSGRQLSVERLWKVEEEWDNFLATRSKSGSDSQQDAAALAKGDALDDELMSLGSFENVARSCGEGEENDEVNLGQLLRKERSEFVHLVLLRHFA